MTDLATLAPLVEHFKKAVAANKIATYRPYDWQKLFHAYGADHPERMLMAANRVGKCCTFNTLVETTKGPVPVGVLYERGEGFEVLAWDGARVVTAPARRPFKKPGLHLCYRFETDRGWFECADHHLIFCDGEWQQAERLARFVVGRRESTSECGRSIRGVDVQHCSGTRPDYRDGCFLDSHLCDAPPHEGVGSGEGGLPSLAGALRHTAVWSQMDGWHNKHTSSGQLSYALLASRDVLRLALARFVESLSQAACKFGLLYLGIPRAVPQPSIAGCHGLLGAEFSVQAPASCFGQTVAWATPLLTSNDVITCTPIGRQEVFDFTVLHHHNYLAGGMVHHNTMSAGAEVSYHLTGEYPDWWEGRRFDQSVLVWTGSPTNETSRDIVQSELLGGLGAELGTGWLPKGKLHGRPTTRQAGVKDVVDKFQVKHKSGGISTCILKTYEQGWQKWQGTAPHVVWMDEEPDDYKIFSEAQTRILTSRGIVLVTFTPLLGVTELVEHFQRGGPGIYLKGATWDDAPHLSQEDKDRLAASYRAHERDARTQGIPMLGEGAVFPIADAQIRVDPFRIPEHFARIKGCDFGIDHPAAGIELAIDRDQDVVYVIDAYRKSGETAAYHAAWFNKGDGWHRRIPVAWPHDGMNREKSGGKTLADAYRGHGVNMLAKSARYPKVPGEEKDKGGPQPVEPIVDEVLERMATGRFKVFANLGEWFEEKRSYHRKDGKIVDRRDDLLKATFYALMMRRYAVAPDSFAHRMTSAPQVPIATTRVN